MESRKIVLKNLLTGKQSNWETDIIVIHTVKGFGIVNKEEIDVFLELSCFLNEPMDVGNLISGSSAFSKTSLNIWKFAVHDCWSLAGRTWATLLVCEISANVQ